MARHSISSATSIIFRWGERQRIEILRCLLQGPKFLIMDEPTSVLTPQEAEKLFETLRRLASEGCSIFYISHELDEIRSLCERATVLRQGKEIATADPREKIAASLAGIMIGSEPTQPRPRGDRQTGKDRIEVDELSLASSVPFGIDLKGISFNLRAGEILGIAGVAGNGQIELREALSGEVPVAKAEAIKIDGQPVGRAGPITRRRLGIAFLPEERLGHGAVPSMTLGEMHS